MKKELSDFWGLGLPASLLVVCGPAPGGKRGVTLLILNTCGSSAVILVHLGQNDFEKRRDLNLLAKVKRNLAPAQAAFGQCCYQGKWEPSQQN